MKKATVLFVIGTLLTIANTNAHAFDGKRKGFQLGLGLGAQMPKLTDKHNIATSNVEPKQNLAISFQIGYGFSNRVIGYFGFKTGSILLDEQKASIGVGGIGGSLYLTELSPSLYLTGLIGVASVALDEEEKDQSDSGDAWLVGIGYEVAERLQLELSHAQAELTDPNNTANASTLNSSFLTLQYVWY